MKSFQWEQTGWKVGRISTRTSVPTISESKPLKFRGFTFLELMVVIALAALLAGYVVPRFSAFFVTPLETEYQHLVKVLKLLRNDAILRSRSYCLAFDLKSQQMHPGLVESGNCPDQKKPEADWPDWMKKHDFPEELVLMEARFASETGDFSPAESFAVRIDASGFVTPFLLIFAENERAGFWSIESKGVMGELVLREQ